MPLINRGRMLSASRFADTAQTGKRSTLTQLEEQSKVAEGVSDVPESQPHLNLIGYPDYRASLSWCGTATSTTLGL